MKGLVFRIEGMTEQSENGSYCTVGDFNIIP